MALYDSENNRLLDTNDNVLNARSSFTIGTQEAKKIYVGENEVKAIYIGDNLVYEKPIELPQLSAPVISLDNDNLVIEEVENAEYYDIYVDGVLEHSIDARPTYNNIHLKRTSADGNASYILNNGQEVNLTYDSEIVLNNVQSLKIRIYDFAEAGGRQLIKISSSQYYDYDATADIANLDISNGVELAYKDYLVDITQYLQNGCYISVRPYD